MSKLRTSFRLITNGSFTAFWQRLLMYLRARTLRRHAAPFTYQLHDFRFVCHPDDDNSVNLFLTRRSDDDDVFPMLRTWLRPGDAVIDAGANLGLYLAAALPIIGPSGSAIAIEAAPALARRLAITFALLDAPSFAVAPVAVGNSPGEVVFHEAKAGVPSFEQSLRPDPTRLANYVALTVPQETLAFLVTRHPSCAHPALVKMDIEGSETAALTGCPTDWFKADGPLWILELNPSALARNASSCAELAELLPATAFHRLLSPRACRRSGLPLPLRPLSAGESFSDSWYYNLIAVPRAHSRAATFLATLGINSTGISPHTFTPQPDAPTVFNHHPRIQPG